MLANELKTNKVFAYNIGDLAEIQRVSFYRFLYLGITEELAQFRNPFVAEVKNSKKIKVGCVVYLYTNEIKLKGPNAKIEDCLKNDISYTIHLYIKIVYDYSVLNKKTSFPKSKSKTLKDGKNSYKEYKKNRLSLKVDPILERLLLNSKFLNLKKRKVKHCFIKQDIFFGEIPLMTDEGTFIINGCERVVISQIIRSPGIYFRKEFNPKTTSYTATVISNKGLWTKFIFDTYIYNTPEKKKKIKTSVSGKPKDRFYLKLKDFRRQYEESERKLNKSEKLESNKDKLFIYDLMKYFGLSYSEIYDSLRYPIFFKKSQFRNNDVSAQETVDLITTLFENKRSGCFSIGEIGRYKINQRLGINISKKITYLTAHDFLGIIDGLIELKYYYRPIDDIDDLKNKIIRSIGELLQNQIRIAFYRLEKNINERTKFSAKQLKFESESFLTHDEWILDPRLITNSLKDFFKTSQLSQFMDQINPLSELTHKRRISLFGPNGLKRDHISTKIRDIHPSQYGRLCPIETPEGQNAGLINAISLFGRINALGNIETPYFLLKDGKVYSEKEAIFLNPDQESQTKIGFCDLSFDSSKKIKNKLISVKEDSFFSIKRPEEITFLSSSPLQIVSIGTALIPFLEHDDANRALMGSNMQRQAVPLLYPQKPIVGTGFESIVILDSAMTVKNYSQGYVISSTAKYIQVKDISNQIIKYELKKYFKSNQETSINQRPIVWNGEKVFSGQIIADGAGTLDGELSLGKNLILAYMPWEGYNYEDAIIINEKILINDCLTSVHIEEHETKLNYCIKGNEKITRKLPQLTKYIRRHLNQDGIVRIGSYVKENDILVGKLTPCEEEPSAESRLYKALYGSGKKPGSTKTPKKPDKHYVNTSLKVPAGCHGRVIDIRVLSTILFNKYDADLSTISSEIIRIYIAQIRKVQVGDKLAGRHGNKGIISKILSSCDMPYLPDGRAIDIIFNPLGVPSRMNVGQVFESLLGLAGETLGNRFFVIPFDEIYGKEASRILVNQKLKEASLENEKTNWIFNPSYPGKILLRDGRTGEFFDNPITVGKSYILKLIHLVEDKIHARATGPYAMITEQPLGGKSQKGGQRFGEMEVWALEAFGCSNTLQELLTIKSDDIDGRNDMYESLLVRQKVDKPIPFFPEAFLVLIRELNALGLNFSLNKIDNDLFKTKNLKTSEKDIFKEIEERLKLRTLLSRLKIEQFAKANKVIGEKEKDETKDQKIEEKKKILSNFKKEN